MQLFTAVPALEVIAVALRGRRPEAIADRDAEAALKGLLRPGHTLLDVGAREGRLLAAASRAVGPAGMVIAFQPDAAVRAKLVARVAGERCARVEPLALGEVELPGRVQTLDAYVAAHRLVPDLIRVDAAGRESRVLAGAKQTLESYRPALLVDFDTRAALVGCTPPGALAAWMRGLGYRLSVLEHDPWGRYDLRRRTPFDPALHCRAGASANVLCEALGA